MTSKVLLILLPIFGSFGARAQAAELQPIGKWVVNYADTMCSASRGYGRPDRPVTLGFRPSPTGNVVRVIIVRPGRRPAPEEVEVRTNVSEGAGMTSALRFASGDKKHEITWINLQHGALQKLAEAGAFELSSSRGTERFPLPEIGAVVKSLETCSVDLRRHWNVDGEAGAADNAAATDHPRGARPLRSLASYVSDDDYPAVAAREGETGVTAFMLMVGETGGLEDCMVEETSGFASIDAMSCGILIQRAKFSPATDSAGKPIRSVLRSRITWRLRD